MASFLIGCDNPPPRQEKKLPLPKGESTLDDVIKKSQIRPAALPIPPQFEIAPSAIDFASVSVGEAVTRRAQITNAGEESGRLYPIAFGRPVLGVPARRQLPERADPGGETGLHRRSDVPSTA